MKSLWLEIIIYIFSILYIIIGIKRIKVKGGEINNIIYFIIIIISLSIYIYIDINYSYITFILIIVYSTAIIILFSFIIMIPKSNLKEENKMREREGEFEKKGKYIINILLIILPILYLLIYLFFNKNNFLYTAILGEIWEEKVNEIRIINISNIYPIIIGEILYNKPLGIYYILILLILLFIPIPAFIYLLKYNKK